MLSTDTTPAAGMSRAGTGPVPIGFLLSRAVRTLLPSAVRMVGAGFQFLSTVMVARALGDGPSAPFFFWSSVLMTAGPIATYGLEQIALRDVPRIERDGLGRVSRFIAELRALSLLVSLLLGLGWMGYAWATEPAPGGFRLWHLLPLVAQGAIAFTLINGESLKGLSRPVLGSVFGHVLPVGIFCGLVVAGASRLGSTGILALYSGSFVIGAVLVGLVPGGNSGGRLVRWPGRSTFRTLLREGFPVCCVSLFGALGFIVPLALCEIVRPASEISHLTAALRVSILFAVLSAAIHGVFAPALSRAAELHRPLRPVLRVYGRSVVISVLVLGLPVGMGILFPERIMEVFGAEFREGAGPLRLLLVLQLASLLLGPVPYLLLMTGHTVFLARIGIVKFAILVALSFALVPLWGGIGMVVAMTAGFLFEEFAGLGYAVGKMRQRENLGEGIA